MVESVSSNTLSIITARVGSKRLPNKNILNLNGKMVFEYTIDYAKKLNTDVVVSTDSQVIINYCINNGIRYINRDKSLSTDETKIEDVIYDVCLKLSDYNYISLLYANIPTRYEEIFNKSMELIKDYDCVMSFRKVEHENPEVVFPYTDDILPMMISKEYMSQKRNNYMVHDGHTILFNTKKFKEYMQQEHKGPNYLYRQFGCKIKPLIHDNIVLDIDNLNDFKLAEAYLK